MNTRKIKEIIKFDVEKSIQNKWFIIFNVVVFLVILIMTNMSHIESFLSDHNMNFMEMEDITIQVVDNENILYAELEEKTAEIDAIKLEKIEENKYSKKNIPADNVILVEAFSDEEEIIKIKLVSKEGIGDDVYNIIYDSIVDVRNELFATKHSITVEELGKLSSEPEIERVFLGVDAENSEIKELIKMISVVLVYMVLVMVTSKIASTIAQEKTSKSIEYVLTSVSAKEYLLAKVLGITITTLVQVLYTAVYYMIGNLINTIIIMNSGNVSTSGATLGVMEGIDIGIIKYVLAMAAYLVFTVFFITLVQATLSSKTNSVDEAGNTTTLLLFSTMILYFISLGAITPYTNVSMFMYIISCLPIVSTFFVPAMMIIGQATTLQIVVSFILLVLAVPLIFNICAKHFKDGILDYTTKKKKKSLFGKKEKKEQTLREKQEYELKIKFARRFSFTIGMAMILFIFVQFVLELVLSLALPVVLKNIFDTNTILILTTGLISMISILVTVSFIKAYNPQEKTNRKISRKNSFNLIFVGIALICLLQLVLPYLYKWLGIDYNALEMFEVSPGSGVLSSVIFFIVLAVLPAIFEELLCRKAILNLAKRYGNLFAVVFSAMIFALIHLNMGQAIFAFVMGLIFGVIAVKTNSIKIPVLLHFLNNGYAALMTIFVENNIAVGIIDTIVIAIFIFSLIVLINNLPKLRKLKKEDFKIDPDCRLIVKNYAFIISMVLLITMFISTEGLLRTL